jgi:glutaconyl-CoA/methylmalonyl-CoA decarboxylase subunit delta
MVILNSFIDFANLKSDHWIIVFVGYVIVFISLFILWMVFYNLPTLLHFNPRKFFRSKKVEVVENGVANSILSGEEAAAISAAIFLFVEELHDEENRVLTIDRISRRYSPWSSKIYNVTQGLNKRF